MLLLLFKKTWMYCLCSLNDQSSLLFYLYHFLFPLLFFCGLLYFSSQSKILLSDICFSFFSWQGFSPPGVNTVIPYWWLSYEMLTVLLLKSGNVVKKDRYDCPSFPENTAVIRGVHRKLFCFSSQGNFGVHILLFIFQTYTVATPLKTLLDLIP